MWLSDNATTDQATQVIAVQLNVTSDPAARTVELKLKALMAARDAIANAIAELGRLRSRTR